MRVTVRYHIFCALLITVCGLAISAVQAEGETVAMKFSSDGQYMALLNTGGDLLVCDTSDFRIVMQVDGTIKGNTFAWRPGTHTMAVTLDQGEGWDIWLIDLDGKSKRLTTHPAMDCQPCWIDRGATLLFVSYRLGCADLFSVSVDNDLLDKAVSTTRPRTEGFDFAPPATRFLTHVSNQWNPLSSPDGETLAFFSMQGDLPSVCIVARGREMMQIGSLGEYYRFRDGGDMAWEASGRFLLYVEQTEERAVLHTYDLETGRNEPLLRAQSIANPCLDAASGDLIAVVDGQLTHWHIKMVRGMPDTTGWGRTLRAGGLSLTQPQIYNHDGKRQWAVLAEGRGPAFLDSLSERLFRIPSIHAKSHLYYAERLYDSGLDKEAESFYSALDRAPLQPQERSSALIHHAVRLRKAGKPRAALQLLDQISNIEPPVVDPAQILALQASIMLYEMEMPGVARLMFENIANAYYGKTPPPNNVEEPMAILAHNDSEIIRLYAQSHTDVRKDNISAGLKTMLQLAHYAPGNNRVREAILNLLGDAYEGESIIERPNPFKDSRYSNRIVEILTTLSAQQSRPEEETEQDRSVASRLRHELLNAQLLANDFVDARETTRLILSEEGVEGLGLKEFLQFYLDTERSERDIQDLLGKVILDPRLQPSIRQYVTQDTVSQILLLLARIKLALLEGETNLASRLLLVTSEQMRRASPGGASKEIIGLQYYLFLFDAKLKEQTGQFDEAAQSYETAMRMVEQYDPEQTGRIFNMEATIELIGALKPQEQTNDSTHSQTQYQTGAGNNTIERQRLWEMQVALRGMGDPLMNPTFDTWQLRVGAKGLRQVMAETSPSPMDSYLLFQLGYCMARSNMCQRAMHYFGRALAANPSPALKRTILYEMSSLFGDSQNFYLQWESLGGLVPLASEGIQRDAIRLQLVPPLMKINRELDALTLLEELRRVPTTPSIRTTAESLLQAMEAETFEVLEAPKIRVIMK